MNNKLVALVTGANKGIGFETARKLASHGMKVILTARDATRGTEASSKLAGKGMDVSFQQLDVTDSEDVNRVAAFVEKEFGRLDILINNAGIAIDDQHNSTDVDLDLVRQTLEVNLFGPWRMCQTFLPLMQKQDLGWIINMTSRMGSLDDLEGWAPGYRLSKAALNAMTKMMAYELEGSNIKIHAVCPGWINTEMGGDDAPGTVDNPAEFISNLVMGLDTDPFSSISLPEIIV